MVLHQISGSGHLAKLCGQINRKSIHFKNAVDVAKLLIQFSLVQFSLFYMIKLFTSTTVQLTEIKCNTVKSKHIQILSN